MLKDWLKLPEAKSIKNLDDPGTTLLHAEIIRKKPFLRKLYTDFYRTFGGCVPGIESKHCVELGSGGGFIKEIFPTVVTTDVLDLPHLDRRFSVMDMPFERESVDAFFMIDLLHHVPHPAAFFREIIRCLKKGGKAVMIEPANTRWAQFIYRNFHHEPFDPSAGWELPQDGGPLSRANGALPWIIFCRDREQFDKQFPQLRIARLAPHTPCRYLISGGLSMRALLPAFTYSWVKGMEFALKPFNRLLGMFLTVELEKC